jgi:N-acetyl sugar amidotransferase
MSLLVQYQICNRCIIDTSIPGVVFDEVGVCSGCRSYDQLSAQGFQSAETRQAALDQIVARIKADGQGKPFDCIVGVSGGVDSTYVALLAKRLGLRPLAVHLDNGWNSNLAVSNIEKCCRTLGIELVTHVLDWEEFKDIQLAFLKASTPDSEIPTDHAILSVLSERARQVGTPYILSGVNTSTEGITIPNATGNQYDWKYIRSIHALFGARSIRTFPHLSLLGFFRARYLLRQRQIHLLDLIDFNKEAAAAELCVELGWQPYAGKHHESVYTRFFQTCYLPIKFGFDKRRIHLSNLIISGQLNRNEALKEIQSPVATPKEQSEDIQYVAKKFNISIEQLNYLMQTAPKSWSEYPCSEKDWPLRIWRQFKKINSKY